MKYILKNIIKCMLLFIGAPLLCIITVGYSYTFYKEHLHTYITPEGVKSLNIDGELLTYTSYGNQNNQPIVLLHGTGANSFIWKETAIFLSKNNYYVLAVDLVPFGWSEIPKNQDYRKEVQAKRVIDLLTALEVKNPILLGHSFNSKIALQITSLFPVKKLILVAPVIDYVEKDPESSILSFVMSITPLRDPVLSLFVNNTLLADSLLKSFMYKKDVEIEEVLKMTILPFNKKGVNHAYGEWFQEFFTETSLISDRKTLRDLTVPMSVLWGDKDTISPLANFTKLQKIYPGAKLVELREVGHMPHLEDSELFNTRLLEVLK